MLPPPPPPLPQPPKTENGARTHFGHRDPDQPSYDRQPPIVRPICSTRSGRSFVIDDAEGVGILAAPDEAPPVGAAGSSASRLICSSPIICRSRLLAPTVEILGRPSPSCTSLRPPPHGIRTWMVSGSYSRRGQLGSEVILDDFYFIQIDVGLALTFQNQPSGPRLVLADE